MAETINIKVDKRVIRVPAGTEMSARLLESLIQKHKELIKGKYKELDDAYIGDYAIFHGARKPAWKPDNRIAINFARYISDTFTGFFDGIPVKMNVTGEDPSGKIKDYVELLDARNNMDDQNAELCKLSNNFGIAYEMYYNDEQGETGIIHLSPLEAFMVYDDSILSRPMFFVRYTKGADDIERGSYSDSSVVRHFECKGGLRFTDEGYEHYFGEVPATEYVHNAERIGIYEDALSAINAFNKALSEKADNVEYFADAYLKVVGPRVDEDDTKFIRDTRIINLYKDPTRAGESDTMDAAFLAKPDSDSTEEHLLDRLFRLIFQLSMVVNISDESFGSASGIALKYKLTVMYNLFRTKSRKFGAAMARRYKIIFSSPCARTHGVDPQAWTGVVPVFTPNFPANTSEEVENAAKLDGVVSRATQLSLLSFIDDTNAEIEAIQAEQEQLIEQADNYRNYRGDRGQNDNSATATEDNDS